METPSGLPQNSGNSNNQQQDSVQPTVDADFDESTKYKRKKIPKDVVEII